MILTLLTPEVIFGKAVADLRSCLWHTDQLAQLAREDNVPWTRYHTSFADMGGFVITFPIDHSKPATVSGDKPPSLSGVALDPGPPIDLGTRTSSDGRRSGAAPDQQGICAPSLDIDLEAGISPLGPAFSASTNSSSTLTVSNEAASRTTRPEPPSSKRKTTMIRLYRLARLRTLFGERRTHEEIRATMQHNLERHGRLYGPVERQFHPELVRMSKQLANELQDCPDRIPRGLNKRCYLVSLAALEGDASPLSAAQLLEARRTGLLSQLPLVQETMLRDKDKSDTLVKLAAVWQVLWLVVDLISRETSALPSSPLEFMVLAFSVLALLIYLMNWFKPKDVQVPFYVHSSRLPTLEEFHRLAMLRPNGLGKTHVFSELSFVVQRSERSEDEFMTKYEWNRKAWYTGVAWSGMVFGSVHLLAWNFAFPTTVERWLWRASAIITAVGPMGPGLPAFALTTLLRPCLRDRGILSFVTLYGISVTAILACCRLFLFVEAYRSLYFLEPKTYLTTWTSDVPHLG